MTMEVSSLFLKPSLPLKIVIEIWEGMSKLTTCLPVHMGTGLTMAGMGSSPKSSLRVGSIQMMRFMIYSLVRKVSRMVSR